MDPLESISQGERPLSIWQRPSAVVCIVHSVAKPVCFGLAPPTLACSLCVLWSMEVNPLDFACLWILLVYGGFQSAGQVNGGARVRADWLECLCAAETPYWHLTLPQSGLEWEKHLQRRLALDLEDLIST